jgi:hypothetical protein
MHNKHSFIFDGSDYIDTQTGEVMSEGVPIWVGKRTAFTRLYGKGFFVMAQDPIALIARDKELVGRPMQVFMYLCSRLDFDNFIRVPQTEICEALDMRKPHVSRAIKLLDDKGILIRGPKVGHSYAFRLNPTYGYKGNPRGKVLSMGNGRNVFRQADDDKEEAGIPQASEGDIASSDVF